MFHQLDKSGLRVSSARVQAIGMLPAPLDLQGGGRRHSAQLCSGVEYVQSFLQRCRQKYLRPSLLESLVGKGFYVGCSHQIQGLNFETVNMDQNPNLKLLSLQKNVIYR